MSTTRPTDRAPGPRRTRRFGLVLSALLFAAVAPAGAQQIEFQPANLAEMTNLPDVVELAAVRVEPALLDLVERLADEDFAQREAAMVQILGDRFELHQVLAVLQQETLSPEQRHRLLTVAREQLIGTPRGALGISMRWRQENVVEPGEVEVIDLLPGLPAERVLRLGDRIFEIDNHPLFRQDDLIRRVQTRLPGESIALTLRRVMRDEKGSRLLDEDDRPMFEILALDLTLGSAELLVDPGSGRATRMGPVERERIRDANEAARRYGPKPETVGWGSSDAGRFSGSIARLDDSVIEQHAAIQSLLRQRQIIGDGQAELNAKIRTTWMQQHQWLVSQADQPGLKQNEREYLRRVAERFAELMIP